MTLKELRELVDAQPRDRDHLETRVWLPGSTITLDPLAIVRDGRLLLFEGNMLAVDRKLREEGR